MQFEQLGPYRIGKKLGQGGMGSVFEGVDVNTNARVAVKLLAPVLADDHGFRVRFEAEIDSLKRLKHPNIVRLLGFGEHEGVLFYGMELVEGTTLEAELKRGRRFTWRETADIGIKISKALKHAHDSGIIHRDIKPANILIGTDGEIKLTDFGIARAFGNQQLTVHGGVLGTAEYMSPEQAEGGAITDRCDQYALGGVMFAMLAGRPPFKAKSIVEMLQLQRYAEPDPVERFAPQAPGELSRIISQLLSKNPKDRFANTGMLGRALEAMVHGIAAAGKEPSDFDLSDGTGNSGKLTNADPFASTLTPEEMSRQKGSTGADQAMTKIGTEGNIATKVGDSSFSATATRFTKVDDAPVRRRAPVTDHLRSLVSAETLSLAVGLLALGLFAWYFVRPESADRLYQKISVAAAQPDDGIALEGFQEGIDTFLSYYPNDPRCEMLRAFAHRNELFRAQRKYRLLAKEWRADEVTPVERQFVEALKSEMADQAQGLAKLAAFVDVFETPDANSETTQVCIELARNRIAALAPKVENHVDLFHRQLALATDIKESNPAASRRIIAGLIEKFKDHPQLVDEVAQAKQLLESLP
jgi:serine/threonine-protein kinase